MNLHLITFSVSRNLLLGAWTSHNKPTDNGILQTSLFLDIFSREIGQFQSTWAHFGKDNINNEASREYVDTVSTCQH